MYAAPSFPICPKNIPNFSKCVKQSIERLRPAFKSGDFGAFRTEPLDPVKLDDISIRRPGLTSDVTNVRASGVVDYVVEKANLDFNKSLMDMIIVFPKVSVVGNYVNQFNFGWLNAHAKGRFTALLGNLKVRIGFRGRQEMRNGQRYLKAEQFTAVPKITQIKIHLENAFPDKNLNDAVNAFMNQNVDLFVPEVEQSIKTTMRKFDEIIATCC